MKKYEMVMDRVIGLIDGGIINEGDKVPSVRAMSSQMNVGVMTTLEAYRRLEAKGFIESLPRSGYIVCPPSLKRFDIRIKLPEARQSDISVQEKTVKIPEETDALFKAVTQPGMIPLGAGMPDPSDLPSEELSQSLARVSRTWPLDNNQYFIGSGDKGLIKELNKWMIQTGCTPAADELTVTQGITQGLTLALRSVTKPGDTVLVESPGYYGFYTILEFLSLKAVEVPVDPTAGIDIEALNHMLKNGIKAKALLCSPTFSNPTGAVIPADSRHKLIELSQKHKFVIIEDDTYGELYFSKTRPEPPIKAIAPDDIIHLASFSKLIAPGYRIGWAAGGKYTEDIRRCFRMSVLASPIVIQKALADYLKRGGVKQHMRRLRDKYQQNVSLTQSIIADYFPEGSRTAKPTGGHYLWVELPENIDSVKLTEKALQKKISIAPGVLFSSRKHYRNYLRLNCGLKCTEKVIKALKTIGDLAKS